MEKDWKCVFKTDQVYQTEIAREILENTGINCVVINEHDSIFPSHGEAEVWVHQDFEIQAVELLKELIN